MTTNAREKDEVRDLNSEELDAVTGGLSPYLAAAAVMAVGAYAPFYYTAAYVATAAAAY